MLYTWTFTFIVEDIEFTRERINQKKKKKKIQLEIEWFTVLSEFTAAVVSLFTCQLLFFI